MKFRTFIISLTVVGTLLFLVGIGGFLGLTLQRPLNALQKDALPSPAAAIFVPKGSPLMLSLLVNPDRLLTLREVIAPPEHRRQAIAEVAQIKRTLLDPLNINYERDVQPWLGREITFAVTSPDRDRDSTNGEQPGYLWAIGSQDGSRAREFMQLFWQKRAIAGASLSFEQYAGVQLIYQQPQTYSESGTAVPTKRTTDHSALASAVVGNQFLLFANDPVVLRQAITTAQARDLNLAQSPNYQQSLKTLKSNSIGLTYVNLSAFNRWTGLTKDPIDSPLIKSTKPPLESLLLAFHLRPQGILADTVLSLTTHDAPHPTADDKVSTTQVLRHIPPSATLTATSSQLDQLLATLKAEYGETVIPSWLQWSATGAAPELETGLDFIWGDRPYALAAIPGIQKSQPDWIFVTQLPPTATEPFSQTLNQLAQASDFNVGPLQLGDTPVTAWTTLSTASTTPNVIQLKAEVKGLLAEVDGYGILTTSAQAMNQALQAPAKSIVTRPGFQQAIAPLAETDTGILYADWPTLRPLLEAQLPTAQWISRWGRPLLDHVKSLSISGQSSRESLRQGHLFIQLVDS